MTGSLANISPEKTAGLNDGSDRPGRGNSKVYLKDAGLPEWKIQSKIRGIRYRKGAPEKYGALLR
jgi:hypothetical protein